MHVGDLLRELREHDLGEEDEIPVRIASFGYRSALAYNVSEIVWSRDEDGGDVIYLVEGSQHGYLPSQAREDIGQ